MLENIFEKLTRNEINLTPTDVLNWSAMPNKPDETIRK